MTKFHTEQEFEAFMSQLQETNATLEFYSDFKKIGKSVDEIAINLNLLNYLLGKKDLRKAVEALWKNNSQAFEVMDILIATRENDNKKFVDKKGSTRLIHSLFQSVDGVMEFLEGTGLADVFKNEEIKNLVDYVFGVETGLDSNARKNRSGIFMENRIADIFSNACIDFKRQVSSIDFAEVSEALGQDQKVFDFAIYANGTTFLIEANFYSGGGSKLNEVARAYTDIGPKINAIKGFEFVWITDGHGWHSAKNKLQEAYYNIPRVYNLTNLNSFIEDIRQ